MAIKFKFVEGEGYFVTVNDDSLDNCNKCGKFIEDNEVFYICEKSKLPYCSYCHKDAPCKRARKNIIPSTTSILEQCIHRKIIRRKKE